MHFFQTVCIPILFTSMAIVKQRINKNVNLSARNVESANVQTLSGLNTYRVLNAGVVVLTENSLKAIDNILI